MNDRPKHRNQQPGQGEAGASASPRMRGKRRRTRLITPHPNSIAATKWKMRGPAFVSHQGHDDARTGSIARNLGLHVKRWEDVR